MMIDKLPYPGFSWSFTQHAVGLAPDTLYKMLECAAQFEGSISDYSAKITDLMVAANILTVNERQGKPDAWRDYQQILAELGLIYSTRVCPALTITQIGHLFLAGEIGFSELMGMQAIRYQYPNGQKSVIQNRQRNILSQDGLAIPESLIELQMNSGILIKPAILILRVLVEMIKNGELPYLTLDECQAFLISCKKNSEWIDVVKKVLDCRKRNFDLKNINRHARRNIQDWFKFLSKSDFFILKNRDIITLSDFCYSRLEEIERVCEKHERLDSYWIPAGADSSSKLSWFKFYGAYSIDAESVNFENLDEEYINKNYIAGPNEEQDFPQERGMLLKPIDFKQLSRQTKIKVPEDFDMLVFNIRSGIQKRHSKTLLHDSLVKDLAEKFIKQGATVESDPGSIDLLATWPSGEQAIFEMKTVSKKSIQGRLRTAIGQVQEYGYRYLKSAQKNVDKVIVINTKLDESSWQKDFLTNHLNIGLICKTPFEYSAFFPANANTCKFWKS